MMFRSLVLGVGLTLSAPTHAAEPSAEDRTALLQLAERMDRAWTDANANANAELFVIDATARFDADPLGQGREAIRNQFAAFFKDRPPGLRHVTDVERIDQIAPSLALWDAEVRVERDLPTGGWETLTRIRNVTIAVRGPEGWRIKAVRAFPIR